MKISFVVPAYNEEAHIGPCVESIVREIKDNNLEIGTDAEVVVVNNASTDRTAEIAARYPGITVLNEPIKGLVMARRAGFVVTTGELVANIDADTVMPRGWLATVLGTFAAHKKLVALSGPFIYHDFNPVVRVLVRLFYFPGWLFDLVAQPVTGRATMLQGGNFIVRRSAWERAGGFDTSIQFYGEDADVARRISTQGRVVWSWGLPIYSSGRRLKKEGIMRMAFVYAVNLFAMHLTGKPYHQQYSDIRIK
ncbi:MAG: glycosyltransferase family 2 protein [Patescibacteria group bacterium]